MNSPSFESYSQNGEDVILWRAFHEVDHGRYIDVGAYHPSADSVTMAFYKRGWQGITIEPDAQHAQLHREVRPRDIQIEAAITLKDLDTTTLHLVEGTGLSTLDLTLSDMHQASGKQIRDVEVRTRRLDKVLEEVDWHGHDIHFMSVDTEGSERDVLESVDLWSWRPWVLVVEATEPNSTKSTREAWEDVVVSAGYRFCLFDGLSCFFVAEEHQELSQALNYPACVLDNFTTLAFREQAAGAQKVPGLIEDVARWRTESTRRWASAMAEAEVAARLRSDLDAQHENMAALQRHSDQLQREVEALRTQVADLRESTSWRVTRPLRAVSGLLLRRPKPE